MNHDINNLRPPGHSVVVARVFGVRVGGTGMSRPELALASLASSGVAS